MTQKDLSGREETLKSANPKGNETLHAVFFRVFNKLIELPQVDLSVLNSISPHADISCMKEKLKDFSPPDLHARLSDELFGLGPLTPLIQNRCNSEIIINGGDHIFYEQKGQLKAWHDTFLSDLTFHNFIHRVLEEAEVTVDLKRPFADGCWRGWRVHIIREPVAHVDFHVSFRRHPENPWTFSQLKNHDWAPEKAIQLMDTLIQERSNILIAGPTGAGKTSVLNACLQSMPPTERALIIEDSSELLPPNPVSAKLLTRSNSKQPGHSVGYHPE